MRWWCSAQGVPWTWTFQAYPGVWLFILLLAVGYALLVRGFGPSERGERGTVPFVAGLGLLWLALDWPLGALAAGYLASVHMIQFLIVALVAPPLLLLGIPRSALESAERATVAGTVLRLATIPLIALILFNLIVVLTHWPRVVDGLMGTQTGAFLIDVAWLIAGAIFWWPIICPIPERPGFTPALKIGYLILNTIAMSGPFLYLTFSRWPVYATYELAPPIEGISKRSDQQIAGILMKIGGAIVMWTAITILFFKWYQEEEG